MECFPSQWIDRIIVKLASLPKAICRFSKISIKTLVHLFSETEKKLIWEHKRHRLAEVIMKNKQIPRGVTIIEINLQYRDRVKIFIILFL